jgi:membrane protein
MASTHRPGTRTGTDQVPGGDADKPADIPAKGWLQVVKRGWKEASADQVPLLGAGVAFYAFLALFPALIAVVSLYGLFADPAAIGTQITSMTSGFPEQARQLITDQVTALTTRGRSTLGIGLIVSVLLALWSASSGVSNLITAINSAYDEDDDRGFVKKRLLALAITVAAIVFMVVMLGLVAVVPPLLEHLVGDSPLRWVLQIGRWMLLVVLVTGALAVLYRLAPDRAAPKMRWVSVGAIAATVLWLIASIGFSLYVSTFGNYAKIYGVFAGIIVTLLWLWITAYAILLGAEINAEAEQQTATDTTKGPDRPRGQRDAVKADSAPGDQPDREPANA